MIKSAQDIAARHRKWETAGRVLRDRFPTVFKNQTKNADAALAGMLVLPGTGGKPMHVGNPPRWCENPTGDNEYIWTLNRMGHWTTLLRAYALTGDDRYAEKVATELDDWISSVPVPTGADASDPASVRERYERPTPWRMLEVGLRLVRNWRAVPEFLEGTRWWTPERQSRFHGAVEAHARTLSQFSPVLWPDADHNHYLTEMLGLLSASLLLEDHPDAKGWFEQALRELERCCIKQFTGEGGQIEGCPHYHVVCIQQVSEIILLLRQAGRLIPEAIDQRFRLAMQYLKQTVRPNGQIVPWGDSDSWSGGVVGGILAAQAWGDLEDLRLASSLAGTEVTRTAIGERIWEVEDVDALLAAVDEAPRSLPPRVAWHRSLDQASARTDWSRDAASLFIACRSPVNNAHAHIDPGGFDFTALGKPLLVDPGRYTYREHADRYEFKSARSHNTLLIDDREPFEYRSSWSFGPQRPGHIESVLEQADRTTIVCRHENYSPAIHQRTVTLLSDGVLVVVDHVSAVPASSTVQRYFHLNSVKVSWDDKAHVASTADDVNVALFTTPATATLLPGRISLALDTAYPSTRLRLENSSPGQTFVAATVIVPFRGTQRPIVTNLSVEGETVQFTLNGTPRTV